MEGTVAEHIAATKRTHGDPIARNWSVNFEGDPYRTRADLIVRDALLAIDATQTLVDGKGPFVNLVTPGELGDPAGYLIPALQGALAGKVKFEEAGQCDCGGHVLRAWRLG